MSEPVSSLAAAAGAPLSGKPARLEVVFVFEQNEPTVRLLDADTKADLRRLCLWLEQPAVVARFVRAIGVALDEVITAS